MVQPTANLLKATGRLTFGVLGLSKPKSPRFRTLRKKDCFECIQLFEPSNLVLVSSAAESNLPF
jgi:hypothetical protein